MRRILSSAACSLAVLLAGCSLLLRSPTPAPTPLPEYRPEVVGVVELVSFADGNVLHVVLDDGTEFDLDKNEANSVKGGDPVEGDLFFYGTAPEPWFLTLRPGDGSERCSLKALVVTETTEELQFDFGLILPKSPTFDRGSGNFRDPFATFFCVNDRGEVTRLYE